MAQYRENSKMLPMVELVRTDWVHVLALMEESSAETVGRFIGHRANRPEWVTREILAKFHRAVSVNLGLSGERPGPLPELFHMRVGCIEFFLGPEGRVADAHYGLYILAERQSSGVEDPHIRSSRIFRAMAMVGLDDPAPMLALLSSPTERFEMRSGICQAITETAGEWEAHRRMVLDALLSRVHLDDDRVAADAVRAIGQNKWLDESSVRVIRERFQVMRDGMHKEALRRWLDSVEEPK